MSVASIPSPPGLSLAALVLAGGQSRRMGQDKALLRVEGQPLLARTCAVAAEVCDAVSVVTPWVDRYRPVLPEGVRLITEPEPQASTSPGPLVGFLHGLSRQSADWLLLLACDLPRLQAPVLRRWSQDLVWLEPTTLAYVPRSGQGWEPLCGFYRRQCVEPLGRFVTAGDRSFQRWLATIPVQPIASPKEDMLFNCNSPADWALVGPSVEPGNS
jgi:molybdopterin-guanine dinucleotide biosynthesis protein A